MKLSLSFTTLALSCITQIALAVNSWSGASNYYAFTLPSSEQQELFSYMQSAGMKVLRTWVSGQGSNQKGSDGSSIPDLEAGGIGNYNDDILNAIDQLMVNAHDYGIKLLIGMYDVNSLVAGDEYTNAYGEEGFYTNQDAIDAFNNRITHILNIHKNSLLNDQPWSELSEYIFGFEPQNEPMIFDSSLYENNLDWICNAAAQIRGNVGNPNQLIFTGGSSGSASVQSYFFSSSCPGIDVVAIHDYLDDWDDFMSSAVSEAQAAGKKLLVEEWGSLAGSGRDANLESNVQKINNYGVPWLYWELITNADPGDGQDYEIQVNGPDWSVIEGLAQDTEGVTAAFDFSAALA